MLNIVIADDEKIIREGMRDLIDWKSLNLNVVFCAADGKEALEYISANQVDILITDIRMPKMDGLELLRILSERPNPPAALILSGHNDFNYARQAIQYGILSYMLKPVRPKELRAALEQAAEKRRMQKKESPGDGENARYQDKIPAGAYSICNKLSGSVCNSNQAETEECCGELRDLFLAESCSSEHFKKFAFRCIYQCVHVGEDYLGAELPYFNDIGPMEKLLAAGNHDEVYDQLLRCSRDICIYIEQAGSSQKQYIVGEAISIICHRFSDENLSVAGAAKELGITPNYLSSLFSKGLKQTFSEYLERYRMENACRLLGDVRYKVYEVASMIGYGDAKHFARVFKEHYGRTPLAFRKGK